MFRLIQLTLLALCFLFAAPACTKKKTAAEETAARNEAFKEGQKLKAAKAYQELVENYPDSPFAAQAKERLDQMGPIATPKPTPAKKK
jgi:outer membrane protein assembly factor BamD (BamD/ComL family)